MRKASTYRGHAPRIAPTFSRARRPTVAKGNLLHSGYLAKYHCERAMKGEVRADRPRAEHAGLRARARVVGSLGKYAARHAPVVWSFREV